MIALIAWKNVWRAKSRSLVVIGAITLGVWALLFAMGFMNSFMDSFMHNAIRYEYSHLQVHHPEFKKDFEAHYIIKDSDEIIDDLQSNPHVTGTSPRIIANGMINSATTATGIQIHGVIPDQEARVTNLDSLIIEGDFLIGIKRNPIVISEKMAGKLKVKVRSKVVVTFQDKEGNITAGSFRISGIFDVNSPRLNDLVVLTRKSDMERLMGLPGGVHEIAVLLHNDDDMDTVKQDLAANFKGVLVETWEDLAPELVLLLQQASVNIMILVSIIMLALIFGIINTMLMAVLERVKELGMLMAIGMNKLRVFTMVMIETILLTLTGAPLGLLAGILTINYLGEYGFELSGYSDAIETFGYSHILYPQLETGNYTLVVFSVVFTAILASIYPAVKAIRLKPVEALHTI